MNNINNSDNGYKNKYDKPPENNENIIGKLPEGVLQKIISYLDNMSLEASTSVQKSWDKETVTQVKTEDYETASTYIQYLSTKLPEKSFDDLKEKLNALSEDRGIIQATSLRQINDRNIEIQDCLVEALMGITEKDLDNLETAVADVETPNLFKHVFDITRTCQKIANPDIDQETLLNCIADLLEYKCFDLAIEASNLITTENEKIGLITSIIANIALNNRMKKAWELISNPPIDISIPNDEYATHCLSVATTFLFANGRADLAEEFFHKLPSNDLKAHVLTTTIKDKTTQDFTAMPRIVSLLRSHYNEHPDSYKPSFDLDEQILKLSERITEKDPVLGEQISKDLSS